MEKALEEIIKVSKELIEALNNEPEVDSSVLERSSLMLKALLIKDIAVLELRRYRITQP